MDNAKVESPLSMNILVAPANYYIDGGVRGSEPLWAHEILRCSAEYVDTITAIAGYSLSPNLPQNVRVRKLYSSEAVLRVDMAQTVLDFVRRYSVAAFQELRSGKYSLVHHMLPFAVQRTVSPVPFMSRLPLVVGPVQGYITSKPYGELMAGAQAAAVPPGRNGDSVNRLVSALKPLLRYANKALLQRASVVTAVSDVAAESLSDMLDDNRITVVPPGVDCSRFSVRPCHYGQTYVLVVSGYLVRRKRIEVIFEAVAGLRRRFDVRLLVVGEGPEEASLRATAELLRIDDIVEWAGFVPNTQMQKLYWQSDVLVSASEHEGLPTAYLEAISCGLPVAAASNQGSVALHRANAPIALARVGDVASMRDAIGGFLKREELEGRRREISQFAAKRYDWNHIGKRYAALYERAISLS